MKKILLSVAALLVVLVLAVLVVPGFMDWTKYRSEIAALVKKETGRDLLIAGDIKFSLLPSPELKVDDIRLSNAEGGKAADMVEIRQLKVKVAAMPLLAGNVHVQTVRLIEPTVYLEKTSNGRGNWSFVPSAADETSAPASQTTADAGQSQGGTDANAFVVDDFVMENARIVYRDLETGQEEDVRDVNMRLSVASLNGPFEWSGTAKVRDIPIGIEGSVGRIIHDRTASFSTQVFLGHGDSKAIISGSFINLPEGPKVKSKLDVSGQNLAGLINAFHPQDSFPEPLMRPFSLKGDVTYTTQGVSLGEDGLSLSLGEDRGTLSLDVGLEPALSVRGFVNFQKIDGDQWLGAKMVPAPQPVAIPLSIETEGYERLGANDRASVSIARADNPVPVTPEQAKGLIIPQDLEANLSLSVQALMIKGEPIRQLKTKIAVLGGTLALEEFSAILPGGGEVSLVGVAGPKDNIPFQFDGALDLRVAQARGLLKWLNVPVEGIALDRLGQLVVQTEISATPQEIRLTNLQTRMDGTTLRAGAVAALRARPSFGVNIQIDQIDLDAYQNKKTDGQNGTAKTGAEASDTASSGAPSLPSLSFLNDFDANVAVNIAQLTAAGHTIKNAGGEITIYNGDVDVKRIGVADWKGVRINGQGKLALSKSDLIAKPFMVQVKGQDLSGVAAFLQIQDQVNWTQLGAVDATLQVNGSIWKPEFDVDLKAGGADILATGGVTLFPLPVVTASVNFNHPAFERFLPIFVPNYKAGGVIGPVATQLTVSGGANDISIRDLTGKIAKAPLSGQARYRTSGPRPSLEATFDLGDVDVTPFLPKSANDNRTNPAPTGARSSAPSAQARWSSEPIDTSGLTSVDAKIDVSAKSLTHEAVKVENLKLAAVLKDGVLDVQTLNGNVFNGTLQAAARLDGRNGLSMTQKMTLKNADLGQALHSLSGDRPATGKLNLLSELSAAGVSELALVKSLDGQIQGDLSRVRVTKQAGQQSLFGILNLLTVLSGSNPEKGLADINVLMGMNDGIGTLNKGEVRSPIVNGGANGQVNLVDWIIDVNGNLQVQQNALIGLLAQKANLKQSYPFRVSGNLSQPNIKIDNLSASSGNNIGGLIEGLISNRLNKNKSNDAVVVPLPVPVPSEGGSNTGNLAPPPPPPGVNVEQNQPRTSKEELIIRGLEGLFNR